MVKEGNHLCFFCKNKKETEMKVYCSEHGRTLVFIEQM